MSCATSCSVDRGSSTMLGSVEIGCFVGGSSLCCCNERRPTKARGPDRAPQSAQSEPNVQSAYELVGPPARACTAARVVHAILVEGDFLAAARHLEAGEVSLVRRQASGAV
eukprot:5644424-Prymnesium_polylepis.1